LLEGLLPGLYLLSIQHGHIYPDAICHGSERAHFQDRIVYAGLAFIGLIAAFVAITSLFGEKGAGSCLAKARRIEQSARLGYAPNPRINAFWP